MDGEYIAYGKTNEFLNLYAAFDIYYVASMPTTNIRELSLCKSTYDEKDVGKYRLLILQDIIAKLNPKSIVQTQKSNVSEKCLLRVQSKEFHVGFEDYVPDNTTSTQLIFKKSAEIWTRLYGLDYTIDGLIFTPIDVGVGGNAPGNYYSQPKKFTWTRAFKWKPPKYNTIDFLVRVVKEGGRESIFNQIHPLSVGQQSESYVEGTQVRYKKLMLCCGFNERHDKFMNPIHDMLHDTLSRKPDAALLDENGVNPLGKSIGRGTYRPVPFVPSTPYDVNAQICNMPIGKDSEDTFMYTTDGEVFSDNMIVEFKYDRNIVAKQGTDGNSSWGWVPIRVRYDKTSKLRAGLSEYGNSYVVANDNWKSIHFPVTEQIICGSERPQKVQTEDAIYYDRKSTNESKTHALRDFHNLYVKRFLIGRVVAFVKSKMSTQHVNMIDFAVGKAGDLSKWKYAGLSFVFGVDIAKDNIVNSNDGAIVRYLTSRAKEPDSSLRAVFVNGDSGANIRSTGTAFYTDQDRQITQAIFGDTSGGSTDIVRKQVADKFWRIGHDGFHISSCQFAMHYFFASVRTLHSFLRNMSECTKKDGYFIGTCYNGKSVFELLKNKKNGESIAYMKEGQKIFEIIKEYTTDVFPDTADSIGMQINVYQESIGTLNREYLVNFVYFEQLLSEYGFSPLSLAESTAMGFGKQGRDSFRKMFNELITTPNNTRFGKASTMKGHESDISFLNQYFVYKKTRDIGGPEMKQLGRKYLGEDTTSVGMKPTTGVRVKNTANFARKIVGQYVTL
jgi:mRNA (guanine-N7-)-methyltransferase